MLVQKIQEFLNNKGAQSIMKVFSGFPCVPLWLILFWFRLVRVRYMLALFHNLLKKGLSTRSRKIFRYYKPTGETLWAGYEPG
jgi:hypothetical protein